ncbi:MAG: hypothetical protein U9Q68_11600 [Euryarchaeota archaeon]|nr:hypothetical protein [Euryarchaeota archaeon]
MIICECGKFISSANKFKDFIKTTSSPSTPTFGHTECGFVFNLVDGELPKKYSSKRELKSMAMTFAEKKKLSNSSTQKFLLLVDRLKRGGNLSDCNILMEAYRQISSESLE